jgi:hypothetical protein
METAAHSTERGISDMTSGPISELDDRFVKIDEETGQATRKAARARPPDCILIYGLPMMCRWAERVPAHIIYAPVSL